MVEGMTVLIGENVNVLRGIFLVGKMSKYLAVEWDSPSILRVFQKESGEKGNSPNQVGATKQHQWRGQFWSKGGYRGIILGDNTAEHCFVLRDLVLELLK